MGVADVHQAIQSTLTTRNELNGLVTLSGSGYGGLIMGNLVAKHPDLYPVLTLINPITDLAATRGFDRYLFTMTGRNYTRASSVYSNELLADLWQRYEYIYVHTQDNNFLINYRMDLLTDSISVPP